MQGLILLMSNLLSVSVIIPAYNAAATLLRTVKSLQAQQHTAWEAIIVENGSIDDTLEIATYLAQHDPRIRVARSAKGVCIARNHGLRLARYDWALFLDADDTILPAHLERLTAIATADPTIDAVHCGWQRHTHDGVFLSSGFGPADPDLCPTLNFTCAFAIHACIVRRSLVLNVGGFDPTLRTCEDWDLWLRLSRGGARFALVPEIFCNYLARPNSASMNGPQMLADSFQVISRAAGVDPRIPNPDPRYAAGMPPEAFTHARLEHFLWHAGLAIGAGGEAVPLFSSIANDPVVDLDPAKCAGILFEASLLPPAQPHSAWWKFYESIVPQLDRFLAALEARTHQRGLARGIQVHLERYAARALENFTAVTIGRTYAFTLEVTEPLHNLTLAEPLERVHCRVELEGAFLGNVEFPICDQFVSKDVIADTVAAEYWWTILGRFFERTVYPSLTTKGEPNDWSVYDGEVLIANGLPGQSSVSWSDAHDQIGWALFLREAWGMKSVPDQNFHDMPDAQPRNDSSESLRERADWLVIELADPLTDRRLSRRHVDVVLKAGGVPVVRAPLLVKNRQLGAPTLRAALTVESSLELCRVCVREAVIGRRLDRPGTLRERLAELADARRRAKVKLRRVRADLMPGAETILSSLPDATSTVVWSRHPLAACGTSASRRASLPRTVLPQLHTLSARGRELVIWTRPPDGRPPTRVFYAPEMLWRPAPEVSRIAPPTTPLAATVRECGRPYFENLFASRTDPWSYTSAYEQRKYEQTLEILPPGRFGRALEIACAEGHFTVQLASRVDRLLATDISAVALERTRLRCAELGHVDFRRLDILRDELPGGGFDLIVCSEVLYYTGTPAALHLAAEKFVRTLNFGGCLVTAHAHLQVDDPESPGFDWDLPFGALTIGKILCATPGLRLVRELRTPLYRVQLYRKLHRWQNWLDRRAPRLIAVPQSAPLTNGVAAHAVFVPRHTEPRPTVELPTTSRLPILMYHRIAREGPSTLANFRVAPAQFEAHLKYLLEHDYRSTTLEEWRLAVNTRKPLPQKRIMLTFDDGCTDFITTAWPLMKRYGFGALMFLATDYAGGCCNWDRRHGTPADVLSWDQISTLHEEGVEFGSHTASHPMLTSLPPEEIARELMTSRTELEERLGTAITSIAYPFGDTDPVVESLAGACGYVFGLTCEGRLTNRADRLLALPRIEVSGALPNEEFGDLLLNPEEYA